MRLIKRTWHGYFREIGEQLTLEGRESSDTRDGHGCKNIWVRDSHGHLMNVWNCEVAQ